MTKPVRIGRAAVGWPASEVDAINRARIAGKTDEQIRALVQQLHEARKAAA
jgi:prophage regulatory protein